MPKMQTAPTLQRTMTRAARRGQGGQGGVRFDIEHMARALQHRADREAGVVGRIAVAACGPAAHAGRRDRNRFDRECVSGGVADGPGVSIEVSREQSKHGAAHAKSRIMFSRRRYDSRRDNRTRCRMKRRSFLSMSAAAGATLWLPRAFGAQVAAPGASSSRRLRQPADSRRTERRQRRFEYRDSVCRSRLLPAAQEHRHQTRAGDSTRRAHRAASVACSR